MKKRKGSLLQRTMAVLLSAVLVAGMLSNAAPVTVLAQEPDGQQENTGGNGTEPAAGDTKPEEKTETTPAEGTGSGGQEETDPEGQENPGTTEDGDGLMGQEPGGGMEEKPQEPGGTEEGQPKPGDGAGEEQQPKPGDAAEEETEPGTVSGNDAKQEPVAAPQRVMMTAAEPVVQTENIASGTDWVLDKDGKLTILTDAGMTDWVENHKSTTKAQVTSVVLEEKVTSIPNQAFENCDGLKKVKLPENLKTIPKGMFQWCTSLEEIAIPDSVESIGDGAFGGCSKLKKVKLPKDLKTISGDMFRQCSSLEEIELPQTVTSIGANAFVECSSLMSVTLLGDEPPEIGEYVFQIPWGIVCGFVKAGKQGIHVPKGKADIYKEKWPDWAAYITDDAPTPPVEKHEHNDVTFTAWTATDSLPDTAGNYYLTENVTLNNMWSVSSEMTLCLNGKTISVNNVIQINSVGTLNLYDCRHAGKITGGTAGGIFNIGTFHMYGGEISGNSNSASDEGGGVTLISSQLIVGGDAVISGNIKNEKENNVYLKAGQKVTIDSSNPLSGSAKIGITTENAPTAGNPVNITEENNADYSQYFQSDDPDYEIVNGENNVVQLAVKPHTHNLTRVDAKTATCTEEGNTAYYTCDGCDQWFSDESGTQEITDKKNVVIPAAGHAFDTEWGYKAADGHAHSCKNCDAHDEIQEHTPGDAATESTPQICTVCGYIIKPAIGHTCDPRLVEKKEPDCTTAGKEAYYHCEGCGKNYEDETGTRLIADISAWGSIAALGHDWGEWTVTKPATATTPGEKERICKRCNEKETEIIPKKGGGSGGNSGGGTSGGSDDNSGGNSGDNGGNNGGNQDSSGNGSGSSGGNGNAGGSTGNTGGTGAGTSGKPGAPGAGQPKVKQEKEGNIRKEVRVEGESTLDAAVETPLSELADMVLTKEEKQKAAGGTDVRIVLDVKDASAVVSAADKALVEKALNGSLAKGYTLGQYLDINLFKVIGDSRSAITETNRKITVTIDVPDSLKNTDGTKTRTFAVIRVHDGKAELLADLDDNAETITIKTDRFSTYAVVYKDTAGGNGKPGVVRVSANSDGKNPGGGKDGEPKTGDSTPLELSATLAMIAGFAYLLLYFADRERGMTEETKKELISRMIGWAKQGGRIRKYLALAAIFALLVYYHSIGKKAETEWKAIYGE